MNPRRRRKRKQDNEQQRNNHHHDNTEGEEVRAPIPDSEGCIIPSRGHISQAEALGLKTRPSTRPSAFDGLANASVPSSSSLHDLFRPPNEILFCSPSKNAFDAAKSAAVAQGRWLLLHLHDCSEFSSQILNRDLWKDQGIQNIISSHFLFYQVLLETEDGARIRSYYKVTECPFAVIIDPRTGEQVKSFKKYDVEYMMGSLVDFLGDHPVLESGNDASPSASKKHKPSEALKKPPSSTFIEELTIDSDSDEVMTPPNGPCCQLLFQFPQGPQQRLSLSSSSSIKNLLRKCKREFGYSKKDYDFCTHFPRRNLSLDEFQSQTLDSTGLMPSAKIFVHAKAR